MSFTTTLWPLCVHCDTLWYIVGTLRVLVGPPSTGVKVLFLCDKLLKNFYILELEDCLTQKERVHDFLYSLCIVM